MSAQNRNCETGNRNYDFLAWACGMALALAMTVELDRPRASPYLLPARDVQVVVVEPDAGRAEARRCLALAAYTEARGEGVAGMAAVLETVRTRQADPRWPSTACGVVLQRRQYHGTEGWRWEQAQAEDPASWSMALALADATLDGAPLVPASCRGATHFDRGGGWDGMQPRCRIGVHAFYREQTRG